MNGGAATLGAEDQLKRQNKLTKIECSSVFNLSNEEVREMLGDVKEEYEDDGGDPNLMKSIIEEHGNDCVFLMALIKITADAKILSYLDKDHDLRTNKNLILELILYDARTIDAVSIDKSWEKDVNTIKELFNRINYDPKKEEFYIKVDNGPPFFPNNSSDQPKFTEAELAAINYTNFLNNKEDLNTHYVMGKATLAERNEALRYILETMGGFSTEEGRAAIGLVATDGVLFSQLEQWTPASGQKGDAAASASASAAAWSLPLTPGGENIILYLLRVDEAKKAEDKKAATLKPKKHWGRNLFFR